MAQLRYYDVTSNTWLPMSAVGPQGSQGFQGAQGVSTGSTAPADTTLLWLNTASAGVGTQGPQGFQGPSGGAQGAQGATAVVSQSTAPANTSVVWLDTSTSVTGIATSAYGVAGKNAVINGGMDIAQRGTSQTFTAGPAYSLDRWTFNCSVSTNITISQVQTSDTTNLPNIYYAMRVQKASGNTSTPFVPLTYNFESKDSYRFAGQTVTFSFYARVGANWSGTGFATQLVSGTGNDQNLYSTGFNGSNGFISQTISSFTGTWQRFVYSGTVPATTTQLGIQFNWSTSAGASGAADYIDITGVQVELGSTVTPFSRAGGTYWGEYQLCLPYYEQYNSEFVGRPDQIDVANRPEFIVTYYNKRTAPTITVTNASNIVWNSLTSSSGANTTSFGGAYLGTYSHSADLFFNTASGIVAYGMYAPVTAQGSYSINISAEL